MYVLVGNSASPINTEYVRLSGARNRTRYHPSPIDVSPVSKRLNENRLDVEKSGVLMIIIVLP